MEPEIGRTGALEPDGVGSAPTSSQLGNLGKLRTRRKPWNLRSRRTREPSSRGLMGFPGRLWRELARWVVADVPPEIQACELCRVVDCDPETMRTCPERLEAERRELELREGTGVQDCPDSVPARSAVRPIIRESDGDRKRSASGSR